jgi:hypothetical protein
VSRSLSEGPGFDLDLERPRENTLAKDPDCDILIGTNLLRDWVGGVARLTSVESGWTRGLRAPSTSAENETRRAVEGETGLLDGENLTVAFEGESSMNGHCAVLENDSGRSIKIREGLTATPLMNYNITLISEQKWRVFAVGYCAKNGGETKEQIMSIMHRRHWPWENAIEVSSSIFQGRIIFLLQELLRPEKE